MLKRLADLFEGDPDKFITTSLTGEVDERGKHQAEYLTIHEPVTKKVTSDHQLGQRPIV